MVSPESEKAAASMRGASGRQMAGQGTNSTGADRLLIACALHWTMLQGKVGSRHSSPRRHSVGGMRVCSVNGMR